MMQRRAGKVHIVSYRCEHCLTTHTRSTDDQAAGVCSDCGSPMRIDDLFSDRRFVTIPVDAERRVEAA
jgi:hypothetical protein